MPRVASSDSIRPGAFARILRTRPDRIERWIERRLIAVDGNGQIPMSAARDVLSSPPNENIRSLMLYNATEVAAVIRVVPPYVREWAKIPGMLEPIAAPDDLLRFRAEAVLKMLGNPSRDPFRERLLTPREAAQMLGTTSSGLIALAEIGKLHPVRTHEPDGDRRYWVTEVEELRG